MTQSYQVIITDVGAQRLAEALASSQPLQLTEIAVGDGGANPPAQPDPAATSLAKEVWRGALTRVERDAANPAWVICEGVIPPDVGGWHIREVGIYSAAGELVAVGTYPATYKPVLGDGSAVDLVLKVILQVSSADAVQLMIDPSAALATRAQVEAWEPVQLMQWALHLAHTTTSLTNVRRHMTAI